MTAVLTIPFYCADHPQRGVATAKVFEHYRRVAGEVGLDVVGVGSERDVSRELFCRYFPAENYVEYPQAKVYDRNPGGDAGLRAKFDACIAATARFDPTGVFILGSDDVLTTEFFRLALKSEADLVGVGIGEDGGTRLVRLSTGTVVWWNGRYRHRPELLFCGGALRLSRRLLEAWHWAPFQLPNDEIGVERRAAAEGFSLEALYAGRYGFVCWNVKTEAVVNKWDAVMAVNPVYVSATVHDEFAAMWAGL